MSSVTGRRCPGRDVRRSVALFRAFRVEQSDPDHFYSILALDSVRELTRWQRLDGARVVDVGGGPAATLRRLSAPPAPATAASTPMSAADRSGSTRPHLDGPGLGPGAALRDRGVDIAYSSNVLEHVPDPEAMAEEMVRITRPGGLVCLSWTPWLSPWGGHETSPWHYLGGVRAADRYARRMGRRPKNDFGRSLCSPARPLG